MRLGDDPFLIISSPLFIFPLPVGRKTDVHSLKVFDGVPERIFCNIEFAERGISPSLKPVGIRTLFGGGIPSILIHGQLCPVDRQPIGVPLH